MSGMKSWSTTAASNVLANTGFTMDEGMAPSSLNDSIRQLMADVRTEWAQGANIASAATVDLSAATGGYVHVTGTTTITALGTATAGIRRVVEFDGILTLTHDATALVLPGGANITTAAGDVAVFISKGSGNWKCVSYVGHNANVAALTASGLATFNAGLTVASGHSVTGAGSIAVTGNIGGGGNSQIIYTATDTETMAASGSQTVNFSSDGAVALQKNGSYIGTIEVAENASNYAVMNFSVVVGNETAAAAIVVTQLSYVTKGTTTIATPQGLLSGGTTMFLKAVIAPTFTNDPAVLTLIRIG